MRGFIIIVQGRRGINLAKAAFDDSGPSNFARLDG